VSMPKLRFKDVYGRDFPEWENKQLGDIVDVMQSGVSRMLNDSDIGLPVIRSNNLVNNKLDVSDIKYWHLKDDQGVNLENYFLKEGDLLVNFINSLAQIGKVALFENTLNRDTIFTTNLMRLSFKRNVNTKYISCFFQTNEYIKHIQAITKPAVNQASFTTKEFKTLIIPFPCTVEQTKIANFLTAVDEKITQLTQKSDLLAQYKKGVMQKIFSQELRFKDDDGREFPEWREKNLGGFLIPDFREVSKPKGSYLSIGVRSHCKGTFQKPEADPEKNSMDKLFVVHKGDLIVNITFAWEGAIAIVKEEDHGGYVSHRFPTYTFKPEVTFARFFQYVFVHPKFRETLDLISPGGAGRNRVLSKKEFLKITVNLPSLKEQTKIANFLTAIDDKITQTQAELDAVKQYKQALLQQMFV